MLDVGGVKTKVIKQCVEVLKGYVIWSVIKLKERLNGNEVVLVLTGENEKVDQYALKYLDDVVERKYAKEALIIVPDDKTAGRASEYRYDNKVRVRIVSMEHIELIYKWHCLGRFYKNLVFTYVRTDRNNLLERFMNETEINEEDVVCLALYNLRTVPNKTAGVHDV